MKAYKDIYFNFIRNLLPKQTEKFVTGLDICSSSCKFVETFLSTSSLKVKEWATVPYKNNGAQATIKNLLAEKKIDPSSIYTGLSGQGTLIRFIRMPKMPLNQLKESLLIEADKYFPFSKDQIYMDCHILGGQRSGDSTMDVLVAVAKRDLVKQRIDLLSSLGMQTNFIGINAVALSNAFLKTQKLLECRLGLKNIPAKGAVAILDIGEIKSSLVIFINETPKFTRDISLGGKDLTQKISSALGVSFQEAESLKCKSENNNQDIVAICHTALLGLVAEIKLSFDYFSSENESQEVSRLYLTGSSSKIFKIEDFFSKALDLKTEPWNPVEVLDFSDGASAENFFQQTNQLGVALGLSLYGHDSY